MMRVLLINIQCLSRKGSKAIKNKGGIQNQVIKSFSFTKNKIVSKEKMIFATRDNLVENKLTNSN